MKPTASPRSRHRRLQPVGEQPGTCHTGAGDGPRVVQPAAITVHRISPDDGDAFLHLDIEWSNGETRDLTLDLSAAGELASALVNALLDLPPRIFTPITTTTDRTPR